MPSAKIVNLESDPPVKNIGNPEQCAAFFLQKLEKGNPTRAPDRVPSDAFFTFEW